MKLLHLPVIVFAILFQAAIYLSVSTDVNAQTCSGTVSNGQNLVTNGDFSQAYTGWTFQSPDYSQFTPCGSSCYSVPGKIYAGDKSTDFNQAFNITSGVNIPDHTGTSDNMMLMVDGVCTSGIKLWSQSNIPLVANTNYYFSVWITTLTNTTPRGTLQFDINGTNFPTTITSVGAVGAWTKYTYTWNSGATPPPTGTISIENTTTTGCNSAVDFALDDISFTPGCDFGAAGPTPNLGPDFTICGKTLPILINPSFNAATAARADITYKWYKNGVLQAANSGMGAGFYNYSVTTGGTYAVCVDSAGNCPKTDIIVVSTSFSIDLGPPVILCNPVTAALDAVYTGPGVKYRWYNGYPTRAGGNDSARTFTAMSAGTYRVDVIDPVCGTQSSSISITSNAATPNNATYCSATSAAVSVTGPGKYKWWSASTGGSKLAVGATYTKTGIVSPTNYTFYVEDTSTFALTVGPTIIKDASGYGIGAKENQYAPNNMTQNVNANGTDTTNAGDHRYSLLIFNASTSFTIDTISVMMINYYCGGAAQDKVIIRIRDNAGKNLPGSPVVYQRPCQLQNNGPNFPAPIVKIPIKVAIPQGTGYQIESVSNGGGGAIIFFKNENNSGSLPSPVRYAYPTTYNDLSGNSVVQFVSNSPAEWTLYNNPTAYPGFFDWKITKGINCQRVPVTLTYSCPMPVDYLSFTVKAQSSSSALVKWQTASEVNADRFVVLRSYDGINFTEIATVKAAGNSNTIQTYSYTDYGLGSGNIYYKIAQYDFDNSVKYTDVKSINISLNKMSVYPNPTKGVVTLSLLGGLGNEITIEVLNSLGQVLLTKTVSSESDLFEQDVNLQGFNSGVYFLKVQSGTERWLEKIVKE